MSLIGIFATVLLLSSCSAIRAISTPVDDSGNRTAGGGSGGGGSGGDDEIIPTEDETGVEGVIYVNHLARGKDDGTSWTNAFTDLQDAIIEVGLTEGKTEIWVAQGTYKPSVEVGGEGNRYKAFTMVNNVTIYGGFAGDEVSVDERDFLVNETILSGDIDGDEVLNSGNSYHVVYVTAASTLDETAILDGFIITGGNANGTPPALTAMGGGIASNTSSVTIKNCLFTENYASAGGAIAINAGAPTISNTTFYSNTAIKGGAISGRGDSSQITSCFFSSNSSSDNGGAIYNKQNSVTISGCAFSDNSSLTGGAIYNDQNDVTIDDSTFSNNSSETGGAIFSNLSDVTISYSIFAENVSSGESSGGGAISSSSGSSSISNSTFNLNTSVFSGGAINNIEMSSTITDCTFSSNTAGTSGGAIGSGGGSRGDVMLSIIGSTFSNNVANTNDGGAICNSGVEGVLTIADSHFLNNFSNHAGGAISNSGLGENGSITGCDFSNNSAVVLGGAIHNYGSSPEITDSLFDGNVCTSGPGGAIGNNEGSNPTISGCTFTSNSAVAPGGAINSGGEIPSVPTIVDPTYGTGDEVNTPDDVYPAVPAPEELPAIGDSYKGGKLAYVFEVGDLGYVEGETHGLIAAVEDQSPGIRWFNGDWMTVVSGTSTDLGKGFDNTEAIMAQQGPVYNSYAAGLARAYRGGGYDDWYLPSKDELHKLFLNKDAIGGFSGSMVWYWSSSVGIGNAPYGHMFDFDIQFPYQQDLTFRVRAVRTF